MKASSAVSGLTDLAIGKSSAKTNNLTPYFIIYYRDEINLDADLFDSVQDYLEIN